ncbi:c-type cytochrome [Alkalilimnicola sp. S0819]|uniref:c-type cytochrome n=1 Tax=Alkalilimnicola sp. S0819 TaxID=2613922 RepID=UPI00126284DF|nr:c-type cytochrome [Alkalilimnicola sp. S0819]KAB7623944.1 cytochrome c4 [Alkalilimnicola sp. S0819]MPQ16542.1 c-type cytochrome [Alkalilimnicola sp. S0819]
MNKYLIAVLAVFAISGVALAEGDPQAGQQKAATCAACHGADGNSPNPAWPDLAGQHAGYLVQQLQAFKSGTRQNALMSPQAQGLSEQDMLDLAAYYSQQSNQVEEAPDESVELGSRLYMAGIPERGVAACAACHGPAGQGVEGAGFPQIGGQKAAYLANALRAYRAGERQTDLNSMMRDVAGKLTDEEIQALAGYVSGLYRAQ